MNNGIQLWKKKLAKKKPQCKILNCVKLINYIEYVNCIK